MLRVSLAKVSSGSEFPEKLMVHRLQRRIKLAINLKSVGVQPGVFRVRFIDGSRLLHLVKSVLLIPVQSNTDACQNGRAQGGGILYL